MPVYVSEACYERVYVYVCVVCHNVFRKVSREVAVLMCVCVTQRSLREGNGVLKKRLLGRSALLDRKTVLSRVPDAGQVSRERPGQGIRTGEERGR